jgi:hypothetical protein
LFLAAVAWLAAIWRRRRPRRAEGEPVPMAAAAASLDALDVDWERQVEGMLARGEVAAALAAVWRWLAAALGQPAPPESWTTRELVRDAGRRDLLPLVRRFDQLLYGREEAAAADVLDLLRRLRTAVPAASGAAP